MEKVQTLSHSTSIYLIKARLSPTQLTSHEIDQPLSNSTSVFLGECQTVLAQLSSGFMPDTLCRKPDQNRMKNIAKTKDVCIEDKSAAGMQHTPPRHIFNAKKIILKLDLFMQSLKKIGKEMPKIESEKKYNVNQGP